MFSSHRFLLYTCLVFLVALAGCASGPDRPPRSRAVRGGFSVLADAEGRPSAARVLADVASYARERGFVPQPPGPAVDPVTGESLPGSTARFRRDDYELVVSYQPATHRVSAYLHSSGPGDRKFVSGFYHGFDQAYAPRYGGDDPISETGFADDTGGPTVPDRAPGASVPNPSGNFQGSSGPPR